MSYDRTLLKEFITKLIRVFGVKMPFFGTCIFIWHSATYTSKIHFLFNVILIQFEANFPCMYKKYGGQFLKYTAIKVLASSFCTK